MRSTLNIGEHPRQFEGQRPLAAPLERRGLARTSGSAGAEDSGALNALVAARFRRMADLLDIEGANPFRARAYRRAARTVERLGPELVARLSQADPLAALDALPDIGADLASKIQEISATGELLALQELEARVPAGLSDLLAVPGLGPNRVRRLNAGLGVRSAEDLHCALLAGAVAALPGFGTRLERNLLAALARGDEAQGTPLAVAQPLAEALRSALAAIPGVAAAIVGGSIRRARPRVGDIDLIVAAARGAGITEKFAALPQVAEALSCGARRASVRLQGGLRADLWVTSPDTLGAMLIHVTGSRAHNIALRRRAKALGLKLSEYGLHRNGRRIAGRTEADIYAALGLAEVPPAERENGVAIAIAEMALARQLAADDRQTQGPS